MRKIYVAGSKGMVGSSLVNELESRGEKPVVSSRDNLDLMDKGSLVNFLRSEEITEVWIAAAKVGGIKANDDYPADFIYENLTIQTNIISACHESGIDKILFIGSSCIYPKNSPQPIVERYLMTGELEPTNEPYSLAKIAGIKMCESYNRQYGTDYRSIMPTNLYGPRDTYDSDNGHVIPSLIKKIHLAKINDESCVRVWGSGNPKREFLLVTDLAKIATDIMMMGKEEYEDIVESDRCSHINVGTGSDISIRDLSYLIKDIIGYSGDLLFDRDYPDGTPRKLLDISKIQKLGIDNTVTLEEGLSITYADYIKNEWSR